MGFFDNKCTEKPRTETVFGICDDQDGKKAYTNSLDDAKWIAKVVNHSDEPIIFTAVDNCIIINKPGTKEKESTCDGMLTFSDSIFLVELKENGTGGWITKAKKQLENTIALINKEPDIENYKYKKAYACNKKHPNFTVIDASEKRDFFRRTNGFRIDIQSEIIIKR